MSKLRMLDAVNPGLTADQVRELMAKHGMTVVAEPAPKSDKTRKVPDRVRRPRAESVALAADLRRQGKDNETIAAALGVTPRYVCELLPRTDASGKRTHFPPANRVRPPRPSVRLQNVKERRDRDREFAVAKRNDGWTMAVIAGALDRSPRYVQDLLPKELRGNRHRERNAEILRTHPKCQEWRQRDARSFRGK